MGLSEKRAKGLGTPKRTGALGVSDQRLQNMEALSRGGRSGRQRAGAHGKKAGNLSLLREDSSHHEI